MRDALASRWIDVYENPGKRSGAYSAPVYGVHPYMLLNHNDTLDAVFTLAHEMGHSMHTLLSNAHQPFVYSAYTIFVAEVPSTLSEALFLDFMLYEAQQLLASRDFTPTNMKVRPLDVPFSVIDPAQILDQGDRWTKLYDEIVPRYGDRSSGFTRVVKLGPRAGDAAPIVQLELV